MTWLKINLNLTKLKKTIFKNQEAHRQDIITVTGTNYVDLIVPDFIQKCFEVYCKKEFDKKQFQVSIYENAYATAGIVLVILGLESYRNRIFNLDKQSVGKSVSKDLAKVFKEKNSKFPEKDFENLLNEIFILRDVIVHNHIYKVKIFFDSDWEVLGHRQTLEKGYGDTKFRALTNSRTKKTNFLKLNVQPGKIGFEDLLLVLIFFDMFFGLSEEILKKGYTPFHFWSELEGNKAESLNDFISYYYNRIPNPKCKTNLGTTLALLRGKYEPFISEYKDYFVGNICFKCGEYGFRKIGRKFKCGKCGYEIIFGTIDSPPLNEEKNALK